MFHFLKKVISSSVFISWMQALALLYSDWVVALVYSNDENNKGSRSKRLSGRLDISTSSHMNSLRFYHESQSLISDDRYALRFLNIAVMLPLAWFEQNSIHVADEDVVCLGTASSNVFEPIARSLHAHSPSSLMESSILSFILGNSVRERIHWSLEQNETQGKKLTFCCSDKPDLFNRVLIIYWFLRPRKVDCWWCITW